jgi:CheY-like chemotaxis protein
MAVDQKLTPDALAGVQVLFVDDNEDSVEIMQIALEHAGALVMATTSVRAALKILEHFVPDVILSDLKMPHEDGLTLVRQLRGMPILRTIPVLAVTGYEEFYDRRDLLEFGFIGVMRKPLNYPDLILTVGALAQAHKHRH